MLHCKYSLYPILWVHVWPFLKNALISSTINGLEQNLFPIMTFGMLIMFWKQKWTLNLEHKEYIKTNLMFLNCLCICWISWGPLWPFHSLASSNGSGHADCSLGLWSSCLINDCVFRSSSGLPVSYSACSK